MRPAFAFAHAAAILCMQIAPVAADDFPDARVPPPLFADSSGMVPGLFGVGLKGNDAYLDGSFFLTAPFHSTIGRDGTFSGSVWLIEPYVSHGEEGETAVSLGLAWRHLFSNQRLSALPLAQGQPSAGFLEQGFFVGANLFGDLLDTQFNNRFWQLGGGLEFGSRYLEVRTNYYLPLSESQSGQFTKTTNLGTVTEATYGEPYPSSHRILQDARLDTFELNLEQLFRYEEDGMEGWDAEVAVLVPWVDRWMDAKILAGYYAFDNQPFGPQEGGTGNVEGWKAGLELRPVPAVVLSASWFEDERLTGGDWAAGFRFELPFEIGGDVGGMKFDERVRESFRPRSRHLVERLSEPVKRQNSAIKVTGSVEEDQSAREVARGALTGSEDKPRVVVSESVVFVDNKIGRAGNPGTYERPVDTIQGGENLGNRLFGNDAEVFVQGRPAAYEESVVISQSVKLYGSEAGFPGFGDFAFHGRTKRMPLVRGGFVASGIPGEVRIEGFEITGGQQVDLNLDSALLGRVGDGILLVNVARGVVSRNYIHHTDARGIRIVSNGRNLSDIWIQDNRISLPAWHGVDLQSKDASRMTATVEGNQILKSGMSGVYALNLASIELTLRGNQISENRGDGIYLQTGDLLLRPYGARGNCWITGNEILRNDGIGISARASGTTTGNFWIHENRVEKNLGGIFVEADGHLTGNFWVEDNVIVNNNLSFDSNGFGFKAQAIGGAATVTFSGNDLFGNMGHHIQATDGIRFISEGTRSNTVGPARGYLGARYKPFGVPEGFILINGTLHRAGSELP